MSATTQVDSAPPNDIIIDIPEEYLENGKTLLIEEYFELFVDGYHLSKPARYIKHVHQLCLLDTLVQDTKSVTSTHQLKSDIDDNQLVQIILEFPCESLKNGKSVKIEETSQGGNEEVSGNFDDLFNPSKADITIDIKILSQSLQRGTAILIGKDKMSILKSDDYQKDQKHHLDNNAIAKNDHLRSKNLMQLIIEVPPEFFHTGRTITCRKEDAQTTAANFPYHRSSKPQL